MSTQNTELKKTMLNNLLGGKIELWPIAVHSYLEEKGLPFKKGNEVVDMIKDNQQSLYVGISSLSKSPISKEDLLMLENFQIMAYLKAGRTSIPSRHKFISEYFGYLMEPEKVRDDRFNLAEEDAFKDAFEAIENIEQNQPLLRRLITVLLMKQEYACERKLHDHLPMLFDIVNKTVDAIGGKPLPLERKTSQWFLV